MSITYPPEMLPVADEPAEVIVVGCDGSGMCWRQDFYEDGSPARSISEWPCEGCENCKKATN